MNAGPGKLSFMGDGAIGRSALGDGGDFLTGGGEMARLIAAKDWSQTPLGAIETWPQSLRTTVSLCLASHFPINIIWGPENTQIYNDGYRVACGEGHPAFLGMNYAMSWASAWPAVGEAFAQAKAGETPFLENQRMFLKRNGYLEERFFTFSISPIRDESGGIGGLFQPVTETTATMLGDRRIRAIRDLTARLCDAVTEAEVFTFAADTLEGFAFDVPFAVLYRRQQDESGFRYRLAACVGPAGAAHAPEWIGADDAAPWPVREVLATRAPVTMSGVAALFGSGPCGPYEEPPEVALGLPIGVCGTEPPGGLMFAGCSSRLPLDESYLGFFDLLAAAMGAALGKARAHEAARQRADDYVPDGAGDPAGQAQAVQIPVAHAGARIVVADENPDMRAYVTRILQAGHYVVQGVADGLAALAAVRSESPALVLTDVMIPGLDGFGLLQALRADPEMRGVPVILLSARASEKARLEGLAAGADDYVVKPFGARELRARIDGAISLSRQRRDAALRERDLQAEIVAERARSALRESESRLLFALEAGELGSWELDLSSRAFEGSITCLENLGLVPSEQAVTYEDVLAHIYPGDRLKQRADVQAALAQRTPFDVEYRVLGHTGEMRWVQLRGRGVYDGTGAAIRMIGVSLEVTPRKRAEAQQKLLLDELNHRVKNTLATVQSIAMQTQLHAGDKLAFLHDLEGRIGALSRAHDLLTEASWAGASLAEIVGQTVAAYDCANALSSRLTVVGPPVTLSPNAAVTLNMAFHELATNAEKYGAFSVPEGRVDIVWRGCGEAGARAVEIVWREAGGPAVRPPAQRGFGSRLLERGLARELGGEVTLAFLPAGLECTMRLPVSPKIGLAA